MKKLILKSTLSVLFLFPAAKAGIIEPKVLWDKKDIVTCFYNHPSQLSKTRIANIERAKDAYGFVPHELSRREKNKVINAITSNFAPSTTGIQFVGWKDCSNVRNPDLIVMEAKAKALFDAPEWGGMAAIGQDGRATVEDEVYGFHTKGGLTPAVLLKSKAKGVIVHEFGHIAGLRHEHAHEDALQDEKCLKYRTNFNGMDFRKPETMEKPYETSIVYTTYDPKSIMNYCYMVPNELWIDLKRGFILSPADMATLKAFY